MKRLFIPLLCSSILFNELELGYAEVPTGGSDLSNPAGHSLHGTAFNEGPRQAAYLMPGMPKIDFKPTSSSPLAAKFVNQGVGQLHGFWYLEAERSFRQAAAIDPQCAIAFWGMAMANKQNEARAKGFLKQAMAVRRSRVLASKNMSTLWSSTTDSTAARENPTAAAEPTKRAI